MGSPELTIMANSALLAFCALALVLVPAMSKPWYQGDGLPDCAPGKCPRTAEISPIKCSSDSPCSLTTDTPPTVRKARSATQRPPMLPREIHADLLEEEKRRVMRGNDAFVEDKIVSKINQSTVVPLSGAKSS